MLIETNALPLSQTANQYKPFTNQKIVEIGSVSHNHITDMIYICMCTFRWDTVQCINVRSITENVATGEPLIYRMNSQTSVSETIRKPPLVKAQTALKKQKKIKYGKKNNF